MDLEIRSRDPDAEPEYTGTVGIDFVTLGMFIIGKSFYQHSQASAQEITNTCIFQDEIEFPPPRPPVRDILGGAGSFSALGARLFSPPPLSRSVGWIVDQGVDFPPSLTDLISTWDTSAVLRPPDPPDRLTTRGWNGYVDGSERRAFRYTTPKKRLTAADLQGPLLQARAIHLICSPSRCRELVGDILARRRQEAEDLDLDYVRPILIWEPVPDLCVPDELLNCTNALPLVDVCSPNHAELAGFMGADGLDPDTGEISTAAVEQNCEQLLASMPLQSYTLVVRAGEKGCYIAKNGGRKKQLPGKSKKKKKEYIRGGLQHDTDMEALFAGLLQDDEGFVAREEIEVDPGIEKWMPAFYSKETDTSLPDKKQNNNGQEGSREKADVIDLPGSKVVDPTGGGNTFLGGLAVALARGKTIEEACAWGTVAASFAIEQVGVPVLGVDEHGNETWNSVRVDDRLSEYMGRLPKVDSTPS